MHGTVHGTVLYCTVLYCIKNQQHSYNNCISYVETIHRKNRTLTIIAYYKFPKWYIRRKPTTTLIFSRVKFYSIHTVYVCAKILLQNKVAQMIKESFRGPK